MTGALYTGWRDDEEAVDDFSSSVVIDFGGVIGGVDSCTRGLGVNIEEVESSEGTFLTGVAGADQDLRMPPRGYCLVFARVSSAAHCSKKWAKPTCISLTFPSFYKSLNTLAD